MIVGLVGFAGRECGARRIDGVNGLGGKRQLNQGIAPLSTLREIPYRQKTLRNDAGG